jgi:hypothetical protein
MFIIVFTQGFWGNLAPILLVGLAPTISLYIFVNAGIFSYLYLGGIALAKSYLEFRKQRRWISLQRQGNGVSPEAQKQALEAYIAGVRKRED